ncbi:MAG: adenylate kinase family protein [Promethearchaeota archaeon]
MMSRKAVVISGSPGTGKSTLANSLAGHFRVEFIDISKLAEETGLIIGMDKQRETKIADTDRLVHYLVHRIFSAESGIILEGHYADIVPSEYVSTVIVLRTSPEVLNLKLGKRGWKASKIAENVQAEILSVCLVNALRAYNEEIIYEVDTTNLTPQETFNEVLKILSGEKACEYRVGSINWLESLEKKGRLKEFFQS